ncbi:hypothetical protein [Anaerosporobacter sp.]|uniref:hypothetical protein n=1 Tax=Anaerosporobacter sp. TaxID=1872529 RepID=UPI00286F91CC|nr:hypothetical protein [Anaerosporobacter sp.]
MKKNFVKKTLASTLALAMVATAMPAAFTTASAAASPALNKTAKTIYINKDNELGNSYTFKVNNQVAKSTYAWSSSNKAKATVTSKGVVTAATTTGNVTISCKITLPTKKTKTLKATVTVKENANKVWISNPTTAAIGIGVDSYDFNSSFSTASGAKATDSRTWQIDEATNTAGATINSSNGKVTTTKPGSFKVRVVAFQNKTKLAQGDSQTTVSDWLTVNVVSSLLNIRQTSTTKIDLTFDANMKDVLKKENIGIRNKTTNLVYPVNTVAFSDDGKTVTVETYSAYVDGYTYVLSYDGKDTDFTTTVGEVATIEVKTVQVIENKATVIEYVLKNANGVDITDIKKSSVTIEEVESNNSWYNPADGTLTIFNKGTQATLKFTYHTYQYNSSAQEIGALSVTAVITAVEESAATVGNYDRYVITDQTSVNWDKVTTTSNIICVGESMNLFLKAVDSTNTALTGLTFESGNDSILLASTDGDHASLYAIKEGSTYVIVKNAKGTTLWSLPVVIKSQRTATRITLAKTSTQLVTNTDISQDTIAFTVQDQYDNAIKSSSNFVDITALGTYKTTEPTLYSDGSNIIVDAKYADPGTYQYKIALSNSTVATVLSVVVVAKPTTAVSAYKLDVAANTVDAVVDEDTTAAKSISVKLLGYANGLAVENAVATFTVTGPNSYSRTYTSAFDFEYVTISGNTITKLDRGTYTITAEKDGKVVDKKVILVSDSQIAPTVILNKTTYSYTGTIDKAAVLAAIKEISTVKSNTGKTLSITDVEYTPNGSSVYIKSVTVEENFNGSSLMHSVAVARTITIK